MREWLAVSAVLFSQAVSASEEQNLIEERIVVSGTRTPKLLKGSPVKVDVITASNIERVSRGTLAQVLDVIPGVVVKRSTKDGYNVQLQGFDGDNVLILMNGQPLLAPTGSAIDLDQISASNIKQIEIVRGAGSVLYGSSAMGGVINIITEQASGTSLSFDYEGSSYANNALDDDKYGHLLRIQGATQIADWQTSLSLQHIDNPGFDYDASTVAQSGAAVKKDFAKLQLSRSWQELALQFNTQYFTEDKYKDVSAVPGQSSVIYYLSEVEQWQQDVSLSQQHNWHIKGRYLQHQETSGNSNSLRDTDISLFEVDSQKIWLRKNLEWVAGAVWHRDELSQFKLDSGEAEVDDAARMSIEAYTQADYQWRNSEWLAGVRVQRDTDFGWHQALRGSTSWRFSQDSFDWQLRFGLGQSYRVPNLKERYYVFDHSNLGYMVLGNEDLVPETAESANVGIGANWQNDNARWQYSVDLNLHYADANDFITTEEDVDASAAQGLQVYRYQNAEQAILSGADLSVQAQSSQWQYQFNYSYLDAHDKDNVRLQERPRHQVKASVTWLYAPWNLDSQLYLVYEADEQASTDYDAVYRNHATTVNSVFRLGLSPALSLRFGVENLLDEHQDSAKVAAGMFDSRPVVSRKIYLGFQYRFL